VEAFICRTCGVQFAPAEAPPAHCTICEEERQYVGYAGQRWTTLAAMVSKGYSNQLEQVEPGLHAIQTVPDFAIGQRALLVTSPAGNVLWDCVSLLDSATVERVDELGGVSAIAISHPHFYASMVEWSRAFGGAPIHVPKADRSWVMRPDPAITYWAGRRELFPGMTLVQCGGHFDGSSVLHWAAGAGGGGVLLAGDTLMVAADRRWVSFMRSYPNLIPLPGATVRAIADRLAPYRFDRIYGISRERNVQSDGAAVVKRSAERYLRWLAAAPVNPER
jgi:Metallo-beta-lactamase superfamily